MDNKEIEELLKQDGFIQWLFSASPESPWNSWYEQNSSNKQITDKLREKFKLFPLKGITLKEANRALLRQRIAYSISCISASKRRKRFLNVAKWTAAAIFIGAVSVSSLTFRGRKLITAANGKQQAIVLPDGSKVRLNSGSSLAYNSFLWKFIPKVTLEGEGYFYGNHQKGFEVKTLAGKVEVLGTQFNVYSRDSKYQVVCYQGKIQVGVNFLSKPEILQAGQSVTADIKHKKAQRELVHTQNAAPNWTSGEFYYEMAKFEDVLSELERQFNIKFSGKDRFKNLSYTGYFNNKDVNVALKMTLNPMGISYRYSQNQIILTDNK